MLTCSSAVFSEEKDVLVIQSYHQGYSWTDEYQSGLSEVLSQHDIVNRVVYLDTKRHQYEEYLQQLLTLYKFKFRSEQFQAIVVNDNNALNLVNRLSEYIGDTPVIFSGVSGYKPDMHANLNATGLVSRVEMKGNVELIHSLQPDLTKLYVMTGHSVTATGIKETVNTYLNNNPEQRQFIELISPSRFQEFKQFISNVPKDSAILYWNSFFDQINFREEESIWQRIDDISPVPVYIFHDSVFGEGAVGGVVYRSVSQGRATGELLVKVLANPDKPLPAIQYAEPEILLDYQALRKWGLRTDIEAKIINQPKSIERKVWVTVTLFVILIFVIITLLYYLRRLILSEASARRSQILIESVLDKSQQYIAILDAHGRVVSSNYKLHELLFEQGLELDKPIWYFKGWEEQGALAFRHYFENNKTSSRIEVAVVCKKSGVLLLDVLISALPEDSSNHTQFLLEANDVTQGNLAQQKLIEREASMRNYYEQQPIMMLTLDSNFRIQAINQFAIELLGYKEMDILGHKLSCFYEELDSDEIEPLFDTPTGSGNEIARREICYKHKDHSRLWIRENIRSLDNSGQYLVVGENITEVHILTEKLEYQARYDLLTETFNRTHFELELIESIEEVKDNLRTHAMLYLDLDQLKVLNDTVGHDAGDAAIKFSALIIESVLPYKAILSRMGGDEFAVLIRDCTRADSIKIAKLIRNAFSDNTFNWENISISITCSIGIRLIDHTADSPQMVHAQADTACHVAKDEGRNRYHLYHRDDEELRQIRLEMESVNIVHDALANDRLELFAQPILDLANVHQAHQMYFEVLVRIRDQDNNFVSPGVFIPASEKYNVAHLIDKSVVTKTLNWLETHFDDYQQLAYCSINLSGQSMGNKAFIDFLLDCIEHSHVPNEKLCIEITETAAMGNINQAIELFSRIKALGCSIALDDFGSGLSSFGYLKKLPVDIVKIDGLFVRDMDVNETDFIMVRSINDLAKQMGKRTVAEFVENDDIMTKLIELGVDYAQGYAINKPKPIGDLVNELRAQIIQ